MPSISWRAEGTGLIEAFSNPHALSVLLLSTFRRLNFPKIIATFLRIQSLANAVQVGVIPLCPPCLALFLIVVQVYRRIQPPPKSDSIIPRKYSDSDHFTTIFRT